MTKKSREEFSKAFVRGVSFSLAAYSLYSLTTSAAESNVPKTPEDTGAVDLNLCRMERKVHL